MSRDLAVSEARARAGQIRTGIHDYLRTLGLIAEAWRLDDWRTLAYADWAEYVDGEFGAERLRLPVEHRQKAVQELRLAGMSQRAIGSAVGASKDTVRRDLSVGANEPTDDAPPPAVKGTDGKSYPSAKPAAEPRPASQREEPEPPAEDEPVAAPKADGRAKVRERLENDETAQAHAFLRNFQAKLEQATGVYGFDAARVAALAGADLIESLERHAGLMSTFLADVKRHRGPNLRLVGGSAS